MTRLFTPRARSRIVTWAAALLVLFGWAEAAVAQLEYHPPTSTHHCVAPVRTEAGVEWPTGTINFAATPELLGTPGWLVARYGPTWWYGALGLHGPDYEAALRDLGYRVHVVAIKDAYCVRDQRLLDRAMGIRISGDTSTPFEPGLWRGRRGWTYEIWITFRKTNEHIILADPSLGVVYLAVLDAQLALIHQACYGDGNGPASDPSAGAWKASRPGYCRATSNRFGKPDPSWTLAIGESSIVLPSRH
jgi:hypothetical protein